MEDGQTKPDDPTISNNNQILEVEDEKDIVKEFVYQHFKEVSGQSTGLLYCDSDEIFIEDSVSSNKTARKSSKKSRCKIQQGAVFSGKILSFGCSECKDDSTYSPNDLLKHFRGIHKGTLPTYPCDLCGFVTHEFPALQRHRIGHRNTLVTCEICNDNVQYSLLLLTRHYIMCHSMNGHFRCEKCEFSTLDAGTFVQHIHRHNETHFKCVKCQHVSSNKDEYQKHLKLHSSTFPFTCQICGYGAARKEYLTKHMVNIHSEETEKQSGWRAKEDSNNSLANSSAGLKLLLKKSPSAGGGESNESQWMSKLNPVPGTLLDQNGRVTYPERTGEENPCFLERVAGKKEAKKVSLNREQHASEAVASMPSPSQETEGSGSDASGPNNPNGLTVLMVKNKISLPPNCTTKVMGFKMVDGKKHLVLKVIPTAKVESSPQNMSATDREIGYKMSDNAFDLSKYSESTENTQNICVDAPTSVRSGSSMPSSTSGIDEDSAVVAKIKHEPEESFVNESKSVLQKEGSTEVKSLNLKDSAQKCQLHSNSASTYIDIDKNSSGLKCLTCPSKPDKTSLVPSTLGVSAGSPVLKRSGGKRCGATKKIIDFVTDSQKDISFTEEKHALVSKKLIKKSASNTNSFIKETEDKAKCKSPHLNLLPDHSNDSNETESCVEKCTENSPNQEVFTFHNYSKETSSISLISTLPFDNSSELSAEDESVCDKSSPQWSLTLSASPQPLTEHCIETEPGNGHLRTEQETHLCPVRDGEMEKVSDSDIEVDECIASVEDPSTSVQSDDENPESVFQDFNIIKIEEESVPVSEKQTACKSSSASLGRIVEEHSDAIISHQLEKERTGSSTAGMDIVRPTKTTLRILKTPEGKQKMFLQTRENRYAVPVQVQGNRGFKLISTSSGPQINVSYMKPGIERQSNPSALALTLNNGRLSMSRPTSSVSEKGASLLSTVQPGATKSHYFVNSTGLKGPLLLAGSTATNPVEKTIKTQPTCYLVQRPIPANATSSTSFKLANSGPVSRQVLAMPVNPADKSSPLQTGRQAFLVRYITPAKGATQSGQPSESTGNKVVFKIVRPASGLLASGASTSTGQPIFLTTRPQTQCFLVASNKANTNTQTGVKQLFPIQSSAHQPVKLSYILSPQAQHVRLKQHEGEKPSLASRPIRPPSQRKRRRKALFDELPEPMPKTRRVASKTFTEKEGPLLWKPVTKDVERTLRLCPFSSLQLIKCPRRYQPVVVLNHPDADIPEVCTIMKSVNRFKGAVSRVSLSRKTVQALSKLCQAGVPGPRPIENTLRERFLLKLKLRKKSKKKYEVLNSLLLGGEQPAVFECWFCGRLFNSQEEWIGHGQRHLMEATRDWNKLF